MNPTQSFTAYCHGYTVDSVRFDDVTFFYKPVIKMRYGETFTVDVYSGVITRRNGFWNTLFTWRRYHTIWPVKAEYRELPKPKHQTLGF